MGINSKIAKIPFFILYSVLAVFTSFNWIRVILFQKDFEVFRAAQPCDYYLANFFSNTFSITHQRYLIFALPIVLIGLYLIPKIFGELLNLDLNTSIKGDNHMAIIFILLIAPVSLDVHKLFNCGWKSYLIPGIVLISLFSIWSWADERNNQ